MILERHLDSKLFHPENENLVILVKIRQIRDLRTKIKIHNGPYKNGSAKKEPSVGDARLVSELKAASIKVFGFIISINFNLCLFSVCKSYKNVAKLL